MIKEALKYIIELQQPRIQEIHGRNYYFQHGVPMEVNLCRTCEPIKISTLTSLVDYIRKCVDGDFKKTPRPQMIIHVKSETEVCLASVLNSGMKRLEIAKVEARVPDVILNNFLGQENFIIQMQSMFADTPDKAIVMQVAGNVEDRTVANYGDGGVSQKATIKAGVATVEDVIVPNPVKLSPFRTFHEVPQPEIEFVFRMKNGSNGVSCALFEADGGAWKFHIVHGIAEYLKKELEDIEDIVVLS